MQIWTQNAQQINNVEWTLNLWNVTFWDMNLSITINNYKQELLGKIDEMNNSIINNPTINPTQKETIKQESENLKKVISESSDQNKNDDILLAQTKKYTQTLKWVVWEMNGAKETFWQIIDIWKCIWWFLALVF